MQNIILAVVLILGLGAGYFIGDYRGKAAQETLKQEIATRESLSKKLAEINDGLRRDLGDIEKKRQAELDESRKAFEARTAEWASDKAGLKERINKLSGVLGASDQKIDSLKKQLASAPSVEEKKRLEDEVEIERKKNQEITARLEGEKCREVAVPQGVLDVLNTK